MEVDEDIYRAVGVGVERTEWVERGAEGWRGGRECGGPDSRAREASCSLESWRR